jgi:hypothetical protein
MQSKSKRMISQKLFENTMLLIVVTMQGLSNHITVQSGRTVPLTFYNY